MICYGNNIFSWGEFPYEEGIMGNYSSFIPMTVASWPNLSHEKDTGNFSDFITACRSGWYELKSDEYNALRLQFATLDMSSQIVISKSDNRILTEKDE